MLFSRESIFLIPLAALLAVCAGPMDEHSRQMGDAPLLSGSVRGEPAIAGERIEIDPYDPKIGQHGDLLRHRVIRCPGRGIRPYGRGLGYDTAVHEASHAFATWARGGNLFSIAVHRDGSGETYATHRDRLADVEIDLAGRIGQRILTGVDDAYGGSADLQHASGKASRQEIEQAAARVHNLLSRNRAAIHRVAVELQRTGQMSGAQAAAIFGGTANLQSIAQSAPAPIRRGPWRYATGEREKSPLEQWWDSLWEDSYSSDTAAQQRLDQRRLQQRRAEEKQRRADYDRWARQHGWRDSRDAERRGNYHYPRRGRRNQWAP